MVVVVVVVVVVATVLFLMLRSCQLLSQPLPLMKSSASCGQWVQLCERDPPPHPPPQPCQLQGDYNVYSKPLFTDKSKSIYRPRATDKDTYGTADEQYNQLLNTDRFRPETDFKGECRRSACVCRLRRLGRSCISFVAQDSRRIREGWLVGMRPRMVGRAAVHRALAHSAPLPPLCFPLCTALIPGVDRSKGVARRTEPVEYERDPSESAAASSSSSSGSSSGRGGGGGGSGGGGGEKADPFGVGELLSKTKK
jgi:uncharacterized membrane protein YgcG